MIIFYYLQLFVPYIIRDFVGLKMNPLSELVKTFTFILRCLNNTAQFVITNIFKQEQAYGSKTDRQQRQLVLKLTQARKIDLILVTELTRWSRSTLDLFHTLNDLQSWGVGLVAQTGLQFDLSTPQGKLIATLMAGFAEFERDLLRERVRSGVQAAQARGVIFG